MTMVVVGDPPVELQTWLARRRALGQDLFDEVWEGVHHVVPAPRQSHGDLDHQLAALLAAPARAAGLRGSTAFNLGDADDYRVPDGGCHRQLSDDVFVSTCAVVVEVVSPHDETYAKFAFYAAHGVDELVIVDPAMRRVRLWTRHGEGYRETGRSELLGVESVALTAELDWP